MLLRQALRFLSRHRELEGILRQQSRALQLCRRFVPGDSRVEALEAAQRLTAQGYKVSLALLGENLAEEEKIEATAEEYLGLVDDLDREGLEATIVLNLSQFGVRQDEAAAVELVRQLVERAAGKGRMVRVAMEESDLTETALETVRRLHREYGNIAAVLQSCLSRSTADLDQLCREKVPVALVKGAYPEPREVAFQDPEDVTLYFMRLTETLMREGIRPAIATHDEKLIEFAVDIAFIFGLEPRDYEFQMYYGVRSDLQQKLLADGFQVRIYIPFGPDWYPYFMRRLADHPANLFALMRGSGSGNPTSPRRDVAAAP